MCSVSEMLSRIPENSPDSIVIQMLRDFFEQAGHFVHVSRFAVFEKAEVRNFLVSFAVPGEANLAYSKLCVSDRSCKRFAMNEILISVSNH